MWWPACGAAGRRRACSAICARIFGLDSLPEHRLEEMDPQARVVNPVWREADNQIRRLRERSGQRQVCLRRGRLKAEQEEELRYQALPRPMRYLMDTLRVRLPRQSQAHIDEALEPVLQALNETGTVYPGTDLRLVYEFNGG